MLQIIFVQFIKPVHKTIAHSIFSYITYRKRMRRLSQHQYWALISHVYCVECYYRDTEFFRNTKTKM